MPKSKYIARPRGAAQLLGLLNPTGIAPVTGPGDLVRVLSAFLSDRDIAALTGAQEPTVRTWRRSHQSRIDPESYDRLDLARVIAISLLRESPDAWTVEGLGAWFRTRLDMSQIDAGDQIVGDGEQTWKTPLEQINDGGGQALAEMLMNQSARSAD